jgi:acetolactate synthase-1/2/3 large subunit
MGDSSTSQGMPREVKTVTQIIVEFLRGRGVLRVYGLVGGHIQPLWDELVEQGVEIIDVRHEAAAVQMAHAESLLTGRLGVAMVTAGPGLTNAVTGIANAHASRAAVLVIAGRTPRPQTGMGAMQDVAQAAIVAPLCRRVESVSERYHALPRLDAVTRAALGGDGPPGPAYIDFPTDLLREAVSDREVDAQWLRPWALPALLPDDEDVLEAARLLRLARRPLVLSGRGARGCGDLLPALLEASGAVYLDTSESRGIAAGHPAFVPAMRGRAMAEADLVVTLGRRLDFQLAYGSPAVFAPDAKFVRIGRTVDELSDNRRGAVEIKADVRSALGRLMMMDVAPDGNREWRDELVVANRERARTLASRLAAAKVGSDGRMHPYTLIAAINDQIDENTVTVVDGGDILSFARVALKVTEFYLDPGPLGCIGVGVPFANAAALTLTGRRVVALVGDGSFGFLAMELDTAARKHARAVYVVANNEGWNIDRHDQVRNYRHIAGVDLPGCRYDQLARALGVYAERVEHANDLSGALTRAFENAPALIDVLVCAEPTSPDFESGLAEVCTWQALRKWSDAEEARLTSAAVPTF